MLSSACAADDRVAKEERRIEAALFQSYFFECGGRLAPGFAGLCIFRMLGEVRTRACRLFDCRPLGLARRLLSVRLTRLLVHVIAGLGQPVRLRLVRHAGILVGLGGAVIFYRLACAGLAMVFGHDMLLEGFLQLQFATDLAVPAPSPKREPATKAAGPSGCGNRSGTVSLEGFPLAINDAFRIYINL